MSTVPARGLVFDPNHESPDIIDERPANDPTRAQTGGTVPVLVTPGEAQPVLDDSSSMAPIFSGWNVWDVYQSQAPIEPTPGTIDNQLAAWVRDAAGLDPSHPIAKVSSSAAGALVKSRSAIPELAGPVALGVGGSQILKRTIAFENPGPRSSVPWPHDLNTLLDAVYLPAAAAAASPVPTPSTNPPALPLPAPQGSSSSGPLMLALGVGLSLLLLSRGRKRR